jgi:uncharacterized membrane protein YphA (DoxX/SURF4 family)
MTLSNRTPAGVAAYILRVLLGVIFVYAAWMKLREPWALFAMAIDSYQVLPMWAVEAVARTLPYAEALLGVLLIAGLWRRFSTVCASLLLAVFFVLMVRALAKGMQIDCGCFGPGERLSWITCCATARYWQVRCSSPCGTAFRPGAGVHADLFELLRLAQLSDSQSGAGRAGSSV